MNNYIRRFYNEIGMEVKFLAQISCQTYLFYEKNMKEEKLSKR